MYIYIYLGIPYLYFLLYTIVLNWKEHGFIVSKYSSNTSLYFIHCVFIFNIIYILQSELGKVVDVADIFEKQYVGKKKKQTTTNTKRKAYLVKSLSEGFCYCCFFYIKRRFFFLDIFRLKIVYQTRTDVLYYIQNLYNIHFAVFFVTLILHVFRYLCNTVVF